MRRKIYPGIFCIGSNPLQGADYLV